MSKQKISQKKGKIGEMTAAFYLQTMGLTNIETVKMRVELRSKPRKVRGSTFNADFVYAQQLPGDFTAIEPLSGRNILVEVKSYRDKLQYSCLEKHQHAALLAAREKGDITLLVWINEATDDVSVMEYPVKGFKLKTSLKPEQARELCIYHHAALRPWLRPAEHPLTTLLAPNSAEEAYNLIRCISAEHGILTESAPNGSLLIVRPDILEDTNLKQRAV